MTVPMPPEQRRAVIADYAARHGLSTFIETGTADGATVAALVDRFDALHTIEVDRGLWERAVNRFSHVPKVVCWYGDSAKVLPDVLEMIDGPALVWADGHWCGSGSNPNGPDSPIEGELAALFADGRPHVILIDDARLFREGDDWASERYDWPTLSWVRAQAEAHGYGYELADDIVRLVPGAAV